MGNKGEKSFPRRRVPRKRERRGEEVGRFFSQKRVGKRGVEKELWEVGKEGPPASPPRREKEGKRE
ncbi:hypothetical protein ACX0E5_15600, partial [Enterococcus faecium]